MVSEVGSPYGDLLLKADAGGWADRCGYVSGVPTGT
jgi:hypothetical protein